MAIISSLVFLVTTIEQTYDCMCSLVKKPTGKQACLPMYLFLIISLSILNGCHVLYDPKPCKEYLVHI